MNQKSFNTFTWIITAISILIPLYAWGSRVDWDVFGVSLYQLFPLFGLLAWMIMCTHYFTGAFRVLNPNLVKPRFYSGFTSTLVLFAILMHPGLLAYAQYDNGQGIPPESFVNYYGEALLLAGMLGTISLLIFLSFEVFNRVKDKPKVKKYWYVVSLSQSLAMTMIFVHALRLGSDLGPGWLRIVWVIYGVCLIPCFYLAHKNDYEQLHQPNSNL